MKQFYAQVFLDETKRRYYALCAGCGRRIEADSLHVLFSGKAPLARCSDGRLRQRLCGRSREAAVRRLARSFNRCPGCNRWVCDDCFDLNDGYGACKSCAKPPSDSG